ncbi:helix-turn-helix domain-containing protein [Umezawaea endophytica]|uniref:Helix-turn-helix transcriptional regulator n=1 Tax=Umezawaea endophytica TaxID=1654476 RepID=A0A9X2VI05_9PSEU|nr:helix-turn-helix transcriptional regulator [Umezawaea endophytica]MCS7476862.1 helix-turn-helix transcriptional regulator [Umezawaea endophytica]
MGGPGEPARRSRIDGGLPGGLFHVALRAAIRERGLTLERLRFHLARRGVSVGLSSLSNWQNGHSRPETPASLNAVRELERVLGVRPESLVRLVATGGRGQAARTSAPRCADIAPVSDLLDGLLSAHNQDVEVISVQHKITVDAERCGTTLWSQLLVRAVHDGVDRYVVRYYGNPSCVPGLVVARGLANCRPGRFVPHPSAPGLVYELVFDHVLRAGETWVFESELVDPTAGVTTEFAYGFRNPTQQFLLQARFDPRAVPVRCHAFAQRDLEDGRHPTGALRLSEHHTVHLLASAVDSGVLGIGWRWT